MRQFETTDALQHDLRKCLQCRHQDRLFCRFWNVESSAIQNPGTPGGCRIEFHDRGWRSDPAPAAAGR